MLGGYLSPAHDGYGKKGLLPASERLAMCTLAVSASSWIMVDSWESQQFSYTPSYKVAHNLHRTLSAYLQAEYGELRTNFQIIFVCGADLLRSMTIPTSWKPENVYALLKEANIAVHPRHGICLETIISNPIFAQHRHRITLLKGVASTVSSTMIRYVDISNFLLLVLLYCILATTRVVWRDSYQMNVFYALLFSLLRFFQRDDC